MPACLSVLAWLMSDRVIGALYYWSHISEEVALNATRQPIHASAIISSDDTLAYIQERTLGNQCNFSELVRLYNVQRETDEIR